MLLTAISCAWVLGIFLGSVLHLPLGLISVALIPLPIWFFFKERRKITVAAAGCLVFFLAAAFWGPWSLNEQSDISSFNNLGVVEIKGTITSEPEVRDKVFLAELSVREINTGSGWGKTRGKVLLYLPRYPEYGFGDFLQLRGKLEDAPQLDDFDYRAYLANQSIYSVMSYPEAEDIEKSTSLSPLKLVYSTRESLSRSLSAALPEPQASMAQGIVLGMRNAIPESLSHSLSITGTAHLLAISGIHLSIIAGMFVAFGIRLFGRRHYIYVWLALGLIWLYALLTGLNAPVIRAAIMASIFLFAELLGRQKSAVAALSLSAAIMVGLDPRVLWDVSFQLSFLAMFGLIFISPILRNLSNKAIYSTLGDEGTAAHVSYFMADSFGITLGAIIAVWPLIAHHFGVISFVGPLATLLIVPVFPAIIISGAITAIIGLFSMPAAQVTGWGAWFFVTYMIWLVNAFAALPGAFITTGAVNSVFVQAYYSILALVAIVKSNFKQLENLLHEFVYRLESTGERATANFSLLPKKYIIPPLLVLAFITSLAATTLPDDNLHVSFLDVGEGDAILIQAGRQNVLIDGGPSPQDVSLELSQKLPFWDRHLDLIVLTHPHLDHLSGLVEVVQRYHVGQVLASVLSSDSPVYQEWAHLIKEKNIPCSTAEAGKEIKLVDGAKLEVLSPPAGKADIPPADPDESSVVLKLSLEQTSFLFMADTGKETEGSLVLQRADLSCTVLKVGHHGSSTSTTKNFLSVAKPQLAVISVGADNLFGHPDQEVVERLRASLGSDDKIYRTDQNGTIEFITDGDNLKVKTQR